MKKIVFICIGVENLGIEYLSSTLKQNGHNVSLVFDPSLFDDKNRIYIPFLAKLFDKKKRIIKEVISLKSDFICFSVVTDTYKRCCLLAKELKRKTKAKIVFGGIHPTSVPEQVIKNDFVDYIVVGEGDFALLDLVNGKRNVENVWFKEGGKIIKNKVRPLIQNLDEIPFPDKDMFTKYISQNVYTIMASRGCPFKCSYCANSVLHKLYGYRLRRRSVRNVIDELKWAKEKFNIKYVNFVDDNFTLDKKWLKEFFPLFKKEINMPFSCFSYPTTVDFEIANLLKKYGCKSISIGIQSFDEKIRKEILNRYESNEQLVSALESMKKAKLNMDLDHIMGFPFETEESTIEAIKFYAKFKPARLTHFYLSYFPNTEIIKKVNLSQEKINQINNGCEMMYFSGGSVENKFNRNFAVVCKLVPLIPLGLTNFILDKKIYRIFRFLPIGLFLDVINSIRLNESKAFTYLKNYAKNIL